MIWKISLMCNTRPNKNKRVNEQESLDDTKKKKLLDKILIHAHKIISASCSLFKWLIY